MPWNRQNTLLNSWDYPFKAEISAKILTSKVVFKSTFRYCQSAAVVTPAYKKGGRLNAIKHLIADWKHIAVFGRD
jgi:hypothetical protein